MRNKKPKSDAICSTFRKGSPLATDSPFVIELETPPFDHAPLYVIGARSYLTDRAVPLPEIIVLPGRRSAETRAVLRYDGQRSQLEARGSWKRRLYEASQPVTQIDPHQPVLDLRPIEPNNWSHALNIAFPFALMVRDRLREAGLKDPVLVCPAKMSGKIVALFERFGLNCLCTSGRVEGEWIHCDPPDPNQQALVHFRDWLRPHAKELGALIDEGREGLPDKVFLDRRDGRCLANGDAVRDFLGKRGFTTIYPEDLGMAEQVALLCTATDIVAIHGAGIAPLMFRQPDETAFRFVEILSPGHMTAYFRHFIKGLPGDYRAIRGRPTPRMAAAANDLGTTVQNYSDGYSLAEFELDLTALELALRPEPIQDLLWSGAPLDYTEFDS